MGDFLASLSSQESSKRLEQISRLRSRGIGDHINLPQLVVCGDQSVGKSSVLEGITGLPFPRQEGLCTRFATEITLTHSDGPLVADASILPDKARSDSSKLTLSRYNKRLENFDKLREIITEVGELMGVRGFNNTTGPAFVRDVLQIKVTGSTGLHLTVVDLPGLISSANEDQSEEDVRTVHDLVEYYVQSSRTINLAVVQAGNDIANQGIIQKAKRFDQAGSRTIGVITKPDLINAGTEHLLAALARNEGSTKLTLGFFLVKNPSPSDRSSIKTLQQWETYERDYFTKSPWQEQGLDMSRVGVSELRKYLQCLLDQHIRTELPAVQEAIEALIRKINDQFVGLGEERPTSSHIRMYLSRVAMRFYNLTSAAVNGDYYNTDAEFFAVENSEREHVRLRAFVHNQNMDFATKMRLHGMTTVTTSFSDSFPVYKGIVEAQEADRAKAAGQRHVSDIEMSELVMQMYRRTRGRELPGNHNYAFLAEMFQHQSKRWNEIATKHMEAVASALRRFVEEEIQYLNIDGRVRSEILKQARLKMEVNKNAAALELKRICEDKDGPPITYNHYYTDNVQKSRSSSMRNGLEKALAAGTCPQTPQFGKPSALPPNIEASKVLEAHEKTVQVDMDKQACAEAKVAHDAYYKVASKSFVDNVCIQVIERHLLRNLPNSFSPELVAGLSDADLHRIAGEEESTIRKRRELKALHQSLVEGLEDLQRI